MIQLAPSILSANFARLGADVLEVERAGGADRVQVDVMDGHFVPNLTIGPLVVAALRPVTKLILEAHLMISNPEAFVEAFAKAGADTIIVHQEATVHLHRLVEQVKATGKKVGVAINPATPAVLLEEIIEELDLVLVMTVNPGFGGQEFIASTLPKLRRLRALLDERRLPCELEVDGGINAETAPLVVAAGARVLVAGSAVFGRSEGVAVALANLRAAASRGLPTV
ncbi:MAG: ribulose-phosphate 3-epimerase [Chloroflexi bacterium]|nr:ribulose-phosphate 3-epimerase [Chloroflexota bacterium]